MGDGGEEAGVWEKGQPPRMTRGDAVRRGHDTAQWGEMLGGGRVGEGVMEVRTVREGVTGSPGGPCRPCCAAEVQR